MFSSIKSERRLSLNHWRYKLLYWFNGINPKTVEEAIDQGIDKRFYQHYCPLFWVSNLILLFSPVILFIRAANKLTPYVVPVFEKLGELIVKILPSETNEQARERLKKKEMQDLVSLIKIWSNFEKISKESFPVFWKSKSFDYVTEEEAKKLWDQWFDRLEELKVVKKAKRDEFVFWVNFSRMFVKIAAFVIIPVILYFSIKLTFIFPWYAVGKFLFIGICFLGVLGLFVGTVLFILSKLDPYVKSILTKVFTKIGNFIDGVTDFTKVFYEENCPVITIVSEEEALIEENLNP